MKLSLILASLLFIAACTPNVSGSSYNRNDTRTAYEVEFATVVAVRDITIEGTKTGIGAVAGGAAGSTGTDNPRGRIAGGVLGALLGAAIENSATQRQGQEVTVRLQSGKLLAVVQQTDENSQFSVGQRVRLLRAGSSVRVST